MEEITLRHGDEVVTEPRRVTTWEKRLKAPILLAAIAVLPLVALGLSQPTGAWRTVETVGHWAIWLTFVVEVAIMLTVVEDRRAWIGGHRFELLVVLASSPLVPLALAVAPALRLLIVVKAFKALKLSKAIKLAKLHKSVRLVHRKLALTGAASIALGLLALALGGLTVAYMVTGRSPLKGAEESVALVAAGVLVTFGVNHLRARSARSRHRTPALRSPAAVGAGATPIPPRHALLTEPHAGDGAGPPRDDQHQGGAAQRVEAGQAQEPAGERGVGKDLQAEARARGDGAEG